MMRSGEAVGLFQTTVVVKLSCLLVITSCELDLWGAALMSARLG